jgi:hypothetical protein
MRNAAGQCAGRVQDRPAGYWKLAQNARKILFRGNEPKNVLKLKELSVLRFKNEPKFERQKRRSNPKIWPEIDKFRRILAPALGSWTHGPARSSARLRIFDFFGKSRPERSALTPAGNGKKVDG